MRADALEELLQNVDDMNSGESPGDHQGSAALGR
jgi:hypothetical protein